MNTMLLGLAWQRGLMPVGEAAILRAIELNGAAVSLNRRAFLWGRILAERPALEDDILVHTLETPPATLDALIEARADGTGGISEHGAGEPLPGAGERGDRARNAGVGRGRGGCRAPRPRACTA